MPALGYIVGQSPQAAVTASLVIVGANASMGAMLHRSQNTLNWRVALLFGGVGMITAYLAAGLSALVSPEMLLSLFAVLMIGVGTLMFLQKSPIQASEVTRGWWVIVLSGAVVGVLTGFLGVGGGFLIVPALVMLVGLPIRQAVGTSLIIIAMNSLAGLFGHLQGMSLDLVVVGIFVAAGFVGVHSGSRLTRIVRPERMRTLFAALVVILGLFLLVDNLVL